MQNVVNGVSMAVGVMEKALYSSYTLIADSVSGRFLLDAPLGPDGKPVFAIHHYADSVVLEVISNLSLADRDLTVDSQRYVLSGVAQGS